MSSFNRVQYQKIKEEYEQAFQFFNNISANATEEEFKCANDNLNTCIAALSIYTKKAKQYQQQKGGELI
jgi:hypothetical protein